MGLDKVVLIFSWWNRNKQMGQFPSEFRHAHRLPAVLQIFTGLETRAAQIPLADLACSCISFSFNHLRRQHGEHAVPLTPREELGFGANSA